MSTGYPVVEEKLLKELGRTPQLTPQGWVWDGRYGAPPAAATEGVVTDGAARAKVGVTLRKTLGRQRAVLRIDTAQAGDTYGLVMNGGSSLATVTGYDSAPDVVEALKTALEADSDFTDIGGTCEIPTSREGVLIAEVDVKDDRTLHTFVVGGSVQGATRAAAVAEASWCVWRVWGRLRGSEVYGPITEARFTTEPSAILDLGDEAAGYDRLFVEIIASDGAVYGWVAPGARDDRATETTETITKALADHEAGLVNFPLADATDAPQGHLATASPLSVEQAAALAGHRAGLTVKTQGVVTLTTSSAPLLPFNPRRQGYACINLDSAASYYRAWKTSAVSAATTSHLPIKAGYLDAGGNVVNALLGITASGTVDVWVEEYE